MRVVFAFVLLFAFEARAAAVDIRYEGPESWQDFETYMHEREEQDRVTGLSYMVSGSIATLGGISGYYTSSDTFSRGIFAIAQTLGVAAVGYGASVYWNGNEYDSFYRAVRDSDLTSQQKTTLLQKFLDNEKSERRRSRWIRAGTHTLLALVNFYAASREDDRDVRGIFTFLGGVNLLIGFSYTY